MTLIEKLLVTRLGVVSARDVADALTHTKPLPGSTVVQVVGYLGWRLRGWTGSATATASFVLPSAISMGLLAYGYAAASDFPGFESVRRGIVAVVTALLLGTMARLARQALSGHVARAVALCAFVVGVAFPRSSPWVVATAGLIGFLVVRDTGRGPR